MAKVVIDTKAIIASGTDVKSAKKTVIAVKNSFESVSLKVDPDIQNRKNIRKRLHTVSGNLSGIESKIAAIHKFVESSAVQYQQVDSKIRSAVPKRF